MKFNVSIPVKPYVKRFLENNYGNPVDFRKHPRENELFKRMLRKPRRDYDSMYKNSLVKYSCTVEIVISDYEFYRYGWELSKSDIVSFGKYFERNAKWLMRTVVSTYVSFGTSIEHSICRFQDRFGMEEEYWPYDSIKKDFYRLRMENGINLNDYAFEHLERLIRINLLNAGVITGKEAKNC